MQTATDLTWVARLACDASGLSFGAKVGAGAFKQTFQVAAAGGESRALKVFDPQKVSPRAEREVEAMKKCKHPGIARFDYIAQLKHEGAAYTYSVEEFLSGGTLTERMRQPMTAQQVSALGAALIDAVAHIAGLGLVHRDLKPDNIMFRDRDGGAPVIVDFGLVRDLSRSSLTKTWVVQGPGTPYFAAPEQLNNDKHLIDWRADQFALGVVLGMCLTGVHAWAQPGATIPATVDALAARAGPAPSFVDACAKAGLPLLAKMVAPWPVQRVRTPGELATAWAAQGV